MGKIELTGNHIKIYAFYRDYQVQIKRRPDWIYANYRDGQNRN